MGKAGSHGHHRTTGKADYQKTGPTGSTDTRTCRYGPGFARLTGYNVAYDYRGQTYTTLMRENPGPYLQVRVSVDPVGPALR